MKMKKMQWAVHQKRWFGKWHVYLGIIAGAILCLVGVTGSILVFQKEIDRALNPELFSVLEQKEQIALENIVPIVQKKYPDKKFNYVMKADKEDPLSTYRFYMYETKEEFFVNPYTAEICGKRLATSSFIRTVMLVHRTLLVPVVGRYIVALAALCLLILTISGLRLWVPKTKEKLLTVMKVNFKANAKRQNLDWHRVLGLYSTPVVVLLAITGFAITFNRVILAMLFMFGGKSPQSTLEMFSQKSVYQQGKHVISIQEIAKDVYRCFPSAEIEGIGIPQDSLGLYRLDVFTAGRAKTGNRILLMIDQYSGEIKFDSEKDFTNAAKSYLNWMVPLHYGTFGGWSTRILAFLGGLMPLLLFITGFVIWWPKYRNPKLKKESKKKIEKSSDYESKLGRGSYFVFYMKRGGRYASLILLSLFISGVLYGLASGIVLQPALFAVLYFGMMVLLNFAVALLVFVANIIFFFPFNKTYKLTYRYFALSLSFALVFFPICLAVSLSKISLF